MKVLIVEDSQVLARYLRASLEDMAGLDIVGHADCVADGVREIRRTKPDVVILDIRMSDGSGIEVLESLKSHPSPPTVIMLTNYDFPQFRRKCLDSGARYYFDKSTEFHRVGEVLRNLVEVSSA